MIDLAELRRTAGMTQVQLAGVLATTQGQISRIERQNDILLSTLIDYLTGLGAEASLVAIVGGQTISQSLTKVRR